MRYRWNPSWLPCRSSHRGSSPRWCRRSRCSSRRWRPWLRARTTSSGSKRSGPSSRASIPAASRTACLRSSPSRSLRSCMRTRRPDTSGKVPGFERSFKRGADLLGGQLERLNGWSRIAPALFLIDDLLAPCATRRRTRRGRRQSIERPSRPTRRNASRTEAPSSCSTSMLHQTRLGSGAALSSTTRARSTAGNPCSASGLHAGWSCAKAATTWRSSRRA